MPRERIRRIESAVDLHDLRVIQASDLLDFDTGRHVRKWADERKISERAIVCSKCEQPVVVPMHWRTQEYFFQHFRRGGDCPWTSEEASTTVDEASARIFAGQQEGPLHRRIKEELGALLASFSGVSDCAVDQIYRNAHGNWRKPDVRFRFLAKTFVLEVQLATTQRPIITDRNEFYREEGFSIIWIAWQPDRIALRTHKASVIDIITDHNDNLFSVDYDSLDISRQTGELKLRVHWWDDLGCHENIVALQDLIYPEDGLPYAVAKPLEWSEQFKEDWLNSYSGRDIPYPKLMALWERMVGKLNLHQSVSDRFPDWDGVALINVLLSLERFRVIGSDQKNLTEVLHTHFTTESRKSTARIVEHAAKVAGHTELIERPKTKDMLAASKTHTQVAKSSWQTNIVRGLFPDWCSNSGRKVEFKASRSAPAPA